MPAFRLPLFAGVAVDVLLADDRQIPSYRADHLMSLELRAFNRRITAADEGQILVGVDQRFGMRDAIIVYLRLTHRGFSVEAKTVRADLYANTAAVVLAFALQRAVFVLTPEVDVFSRRQRNVVAVDDAADHVEVAARRSDGDAKLDAK